MGDVVELDETDIKILNMLIKNARHYVVNFFITSYITLVPNTKLSMLMRSSMPCSLLMNLPFTGGSVYIGWKP